MTTPRLQRQRQADANRRRVRTQGKRVPRPRQPRPRPSKRTVKRTAAASGLLGAINALLGLVGAVASTTAVIVTAVGGVTVAYVEYRRDLIEVKRTGRPIGAPDPRQGAKRQSNRRRPAGAASADHPLPGKGKPAVAPLHPGCQASAPRYCRCPGGPNRRGAKKATTRKARTRKP